MWTWMFLRVRFPLKNSSIADTIRNRPPQNGRVRRHRRNLSRALLIVATYPSRNRSPYGEAGSRGQCVPRARQVTSVALVGRLVRPVGVQLQAQAGQREGRRLRVVRGLVQA